MVGINQFMIRILIKISDEIETEYSDSIKQLLVKISEDKSLGEIKFDLKTYKFSVEETIKIKVSRNAFLNSKYADFVKNSDFDADYHSIVYIPKSSLNLKDNYLWYSMGDPSKAEVMILSSYLFKKLFEDEIDFGIYFLLNYMGFLSRYAVSTDKPHYTSKNCLNDHCTNQIELLNVLNNEKDGLCDECELKIENKDYHELIKKLFKFVKRNVVSKKISKKVDIKSDSEIFLPKNRLNLEDGKWYQFEMYMAKKLANVSALYEKLGEVLSSADFEIDGYSIYEIDGGWRGSVRLSNAAEKDWEQLKSLQKNFGGHDFKDIIRPLIEKSNEKYAVFEESSIVLRIIIRSDSEIEPLDVSTSKAIREILDIFDKITINEKNVFFTIKKLYKVGSILR